jgi:hypothetical protein
MKRIIFPLIFGILIISSFGSIAINCEMRNLDYTTKNNLHQNNNIRDFTHRVFLEIANTQYCGGCDYWNSDVYDIYSQGKYEFEYVNMIIYGPNGSNDILNLDAYFWKNLYNISTFPTSIFDGNYSSLHYQPSLLPSYLDECNTRSVRDITAYLSLKWLGDAKINVDITIQNNEEISYNGYIRAAITEITSRYNTVFDSKFHFGFLDYVFNKDIFIPANEIYKENITWDGNEHEDNHGNSFADIIPGNIQVTMGVFNYETGYVDETVKAFLNNTPEATLISGPSSGKAGEDYKFTFSSEDPTDSDLLYYIKWDDESFKDWFGPFKSGEQVNVSHNWSKKGIYTIKARAKTINGLMGPWGEFKVKIPRFKVSNNLLIKWLLNRFPTIERMIFIFCSM